MQGLWYGDRRDRVKWGALIYIAKSRAVRRIVQVAFYRDSTKPTLEIPGRKVPLPSHVWKHFSDLRQVQRLARATGTSIVVLGERFDPSRRCEYIAGVVRRLCKIQGPKVVFLDPDTGIAPAKKSPKHVTKADLMEIWKALSPNDVLAVYQHADRTKTWQKRGVRKMAEACGRASVQIITGSNVASDVAMLWCARNRRGPLRLRSPAART
jgi:hypothetical protein